MKPLDPWEVVAKIKEQDARDEAAERYAREARVRALEAFAKAAEPLVRDYQRYTKQGYHLVQTERNFVAAFEQYEALK